MPAGLGDFAFAPVFASDDYLVQRSALAAGLGAMILEQPLPGEAFPPPGSELCAIDVGLRLPPAELHLVCAKSVRFVPRVRAVVALLLEALEQKRSRLRA